MHGHNQKLFTKGLIENKVNDLADDFDEATRNDMIQTLLDSDSTKLCNGFLNYLITTLRISRRQGSR